MYVIWTLACKDIRLIFSDKVGAFFVFGWPLIMAMFFGVVMGGMHDEPSAHPTPIAVFDADATEQSRTFVTRLSDNAAFETTPAGTEDDAFDLVRRGRVAACVIVPKGFGAACGRIFWGDPLSLSIVTDPGRAMEAGLLQGLAHAAMFEHLQAIFGSQSSMLALVDGNLTALEQTENLPAEQKFLLTAFGGAARTLIAQGGFWPDSESDDPTISNAPSSAPATAAWRPFEIDARDITEVGATDDSAGSDQPAYSHNVFAIVFPQGIAWGLMACAATFALTLVVERTRGTLPRLTAAPISPLQVLAGKALGCFIITIVVAVGLLLIARLAFDVRPNSLGLLVFAIICNALAIVGVMMFFTVIGKTEAAVGGLSWAIIVIMAMLGGGMMPLSMLRGFLATLSHVSVFRWAILALEGAIWRDFDFQQMLLPCGVLVAIGAAGFTSGVAIFKFRQ